MSETANTNTFDLHLRAARATDWPAIARLLEETWHKSYDHILGRLRVTLILKSLRSMQPLLGHAQATADFAIVVAETEGEIVGLANAARTRCGKGAILWMLYVLPSHQNLGIGSVLMDNVLERLPETSIVQLQVLPDNHHAIRFYERLGFKKMYTAFHWCTLTCVMNMQRSVAT